MLLFKCIASVVVFASLGVAVTPTPTYRPDIDVRHIQLDPRQDASSLPATSTSSGPGSRGTLPCEYEDTSQVARITCWETSGGEVGYPCVDPNNHEGVIMRDADGWYCWFVSSCMLPDGRGGKYSPNRDTCIDPNPPTSDNCTLPDGRPGKLSDDGETCEDPDPDPPNTNNCTLPDGRPGKLGADGKTCEDPDANPPNTNCTLPDGRPGKLSDDGETCDDPDPDPPSSTNCTLPDGRPGKLGADGKTCEDPDPSPGCTVDGKPGKLYGKPGVCMLEDCDLPDGTKGKRNTDGICISTAEPEDGCKKLGGKMVNGKCVLPGDPCDKNGTKGILAEDLVTCDPLPTGDCETANGKKGKYDAEGRCVADPDTPDIGTICTTTDNKPGKIDQNHQCDPDDETAPVTPPKTSTICTSGGEQGVSDSKGNCVVTQRPNGTPVFPPDTPGAPQVDAATRETDSGGGVKPWVIGAAAAGGVVVLVAAAAATVGCQYQWDHDRHKLRRRKKKRRRRDDDEYDRPHHDVNKPFAPQPVAEVPYTPYTYGTPSGPGPAATAYQPVYPHNPPPPQGYGYQQ